MAKPPRSVVLPNGLGATLSAHGRSSFIRQPLAARERLEDACYDLCLACGRMDPQTEGVAAGACPRCGADHRADLREEAVLEQLKTIDEALTRAPGPVARVTGRVVLGVGIVALAGTAIAGAYAFASVFVGALFGGVLLFKDIAGLAFLGALGMLAGIYGLIGFAYPAFTRLGQRRRELPVRWRVSQETAERSPLTGRACSAYEIAIRLDGDVDAAAGTWLLRERCGNVGQPLRRVELDPFAKDVAHFLRTRGIDPLGQDLVFFEATTSATDPTLAPAAASTPALAAGTPALGDDSMRWAFG